MAGFINSIGYCGMSRCCVVGSVECMSTGLPSGKWQVKPLTRPAIRIFFKNTGKIMMTVIYKISYYCKILPLSSDDWAIM